jgi:hypothetical protein
MLFPGPTTAAVSATTSRTNNTTNNVLVIGLIILPVAIAIGYVLGSSNSSSSLTTLSSLTSFDDILNTIEKMIDNRIVPLYAFGVFSYLITTRCYYYSSSSSSSVIIDNNNNNENKKDVGVVSSETKKNRQQAYSTSTSSSNSSSIPSLRTSSCSINTTSATDTIHEEQEEVQEVIVESSNTGNDDDNDDNNNNNKPINMTGSYKVLANKNFGEFLKAQGVPWFLCNAASKARPTHTFTHSSSTNLTIHIQGIIESETTYDIGGSYNVTTIRGRTFHDTVTYLYEENENEEEIETENENENEEEEIASNTTITSSDDSDTIIDKHDSSSNNNNNKKTQRRRQCIGIQTHKFAVGEGYKVHVQRRLIKAGKTYKNKTSSSVDAGTSNNDHNYDLHDICNNDRLLMLNKIIFDDPNKDIVTASQLFHKI